MSPIKPRKPCAAPLCAGLSSTKYCDKHAHLEQQDRKRWDASREGKVARGYGGSWDAARAMFLRSNPLCFDCAGVATLVHHVNPIAEGGDRLAFDNLLAICVPCHAKRHGARPNG